MIKKIAKFVVLSFILTSFIFVEVGEAVTGAGGSDVMIVWHLIDVIQVAGEPQPVLQVVEEMNWQNMGQKEETTELSFSLPAGAENAGAYIKDKKTGKRRLLPKQLVFAPNEDKRIELVYELPGGDGAGFEKEIINQHFPEELWLWFKPLPGYKAVNTQGFVFEATEGDPGWFNAPQPLEAKVGTKFSFGIKKFKDVPLEPESNKVKGEQSVFQSLLDNPALLLLANNTILVFLGLIGYLFWRRYHVKHTHTVDPSAVSPTSCSNISAYREVVFCKKD